MLVKDTNVFEDSHARAFKTHSVNKSEYWRQKVK